jgi:hypothetical protein
MPQTTIRADGVVPSPGLTRVIVVAFLAILLFASVRQESQVFAMVPNWFTAEMRMRF